MRLAFAAHRRGISRIEVIALLFIGVIVLGVFFIFLRRSWNVSNRMVCKNNLKRLGDGIDNFYAKRKFLPAACIENGYATWAVQIVPYIAQIEKQPLGKWDISLPYYQQPQDVRYDQVYTFFCPERRGPLQLSLAGDVPSGRADGKHVAGALGDYAACAGNGAKDAPWNTANANGALIIGKVIRQKDDRVLEWEGRTSYAAASLPRGRQYTILLGEKHVPHEQWGDAKVGDGSLYNGDHFGNFARVGGQAHPIAPTIDSPYQQNFGSYHRGVCQFLYAEGGVKAHSKDMSPFVLGKLTNRGR